MKMRNITESINNSINDSVNEAREISYKVHLLSGATGVNINMTVQRIDQKRFEDWLEDEQDNSFDHAIGGNIEY